MKKIIPSVMIIIISLILLFFSKYLRGYAICDNYFFGFLSVTFFFLFCFGVKKFIYMVFPERPSLGFLLIPIFGYLVLTCASYGNMSANRLYCDNHKDDGYYILFATKRNFSLFFYCGWEYDIWLDGDKLFQSCNAGLCNTDTILIGMLDEGKSHRHFIYCNNPTLDDIEHSKRGWYMKGDEETFFDENAFSHFKKDIIDNDNKQRMEAHKPKGGWRGN